MYITLRRFGHVGRAAAGIDGGDPTTERLVSHSQDDREQHTLQKSTPQGDGGDRPLGRDQVRHETVSHCQSLQQ